MLSLRQSGKKIKGDPDYDAEALLQKIKAEKQRMIAEGKLRKEKPLSPIKAEEIPFKLPEGWVWCRLGEVIKYSPKNGYSPKEVNYPTKTKSLKLGATTSGFFDSSKYKYIDEEIPENSTFWLKPDDILIQRSNSIDYVGVSAIYNGNPNEYIYPDLMMKIEILSPISIKFTHCVLSSPFIRQYFRRNAKGAQQSMPKINQGVVANTMFPLASIIEQKSIIEKFNKSDAIIDEIKAQYENRKVHIEQLMQSVLREAFEGK